jgi:hypothetical protein
MTKSKSPRKPAPTLQGQEPPTTVFSEYNYDDGSECTNASVTSMDEPPALVTPKTSKRKTYTPKEIYDFVTKQLLDRPPSTMSTFHMVMSDNGYLGDIIGIQELSDEDIKSMYYDLNNKQLPIKMADFAKLRLWNAYCRHRIEIGQPLIELEDYANINPSEFDQWRCQKFTSSLNTGTHPPSTTSHNLPPIKNNKVYLNQTPAELFMRGAKRDPTLFAVMKTDSQYDTWLRQTKSQANTQGLRNVINGNYNPSTQEEIEVFQCQQEYMYSVFLLTMQTDFGKRLVRQHENTQDAQTIFSEYVKYYSDSIKAELESTKVYEYLANTRLGDGTWKGTYHAFILHYTDHFRKYDNMQTTAELIPPKTKHRLLENAVSQIPQLATIKDTANITHANSGKLLDYDSYLALLKNAATVLDSKYATSTKSRQSHITQSTQQHEFKNLPSNPDVRLVHMMDHLICDEHPPDDGEVYDIDSPVEVITAQAHQRKTFTDSRSLPNGPYGNN